MVKSINPSLLTFPPPSIEQSGHDVCYLGPNGQTDHNSVTYCNDLPEGQRAMVGSWYLHPERHIIEYIVYVTISLVIIRMILPTLSQYPTTKTNNKVLSMKPPLWMKITTFFIYTIQLIYKLNGYPGKILFMAMPCNVLWTMWATLCFVPLQSQTLHIMHQLIIPYTSLAIVAVATPDTSDLTMYMEVPFFFGMHIALILYPLYFLQSGRVSVYPLPSNNNNKDRKYVTNDGLVRNFIKYWLLACAYFAAFYFGIATPLSLKYGLNLNYMLSPPPNPGDMVSGPNFRLQSTLCCGAAFFFVQFLVTAGEVFVRAMKGNSLELSVSKKSVWNKLGIWRHRCG